MVNLSTLSWALPVRLSIVAVKRTAVPGVNISGSAAPVSLIFVSALNVTFHLSLPAAVKIRPGRPTWVIVPPIST